MARAMKDSGIEWIGEIPQTWEIIPHKYVMHKDKTICEHYSGEAIISLSMQGVRIRDLDAGGKMPTTFDGYQYVEAEDLLMCLFDIDVTPRCVGVVHDNGVTSPAYSRFKVHNGYLNRYYDYLLRFIDDEKVFVHLAKNLRSSLTESDFGAIKTICPSFEEQGIIADFLDRRCAEIDSVIAQTQKTIEEYKALKQSIITEAVTKGIRPNRPMKDSGIEWIGRIPDGWEVRRLKTCIQSVQSGLSAITESTSEDSGKYVLRTSSVSTGVFKPNEVKAVTEDVVDRLICPVEKDTVIMSRMNTAKMVGKCGYVDDEYPNYYLPDKLWKIKFERSLEAKYAWYLLNSDLIQGWFSRLATGSSASMQNIALPDLYNTKAPIPSVEEQRAIISVLGKKCSEIARLIQAKQQLLTELETYKKSVIYEYVTGKKEVPVCQ